MQCDRYGCRTQYSIAFCIVAKQAHFHRTGMQFGRQQAGCSVYAKHHVVCFLTLRELHHLVQDFPSPIEHDFTETNAIWSEAMTSRSSASIFCCFTKNFIIRFSPRSMYGFPYHIPDSHLHTGSFSDNCCRNVLRRTSS